MVFSSVLGVMVPTEGNGLSLGGHYNQLHAWFYPFIKPQDPRKEHFSTVAHRVHLREGRECGREGGKEGVWEGGSEEGEEGGGRGEGGCVGGRVSGKRGVIFSAQNSLNKNSHSRGKYLPSPPPPPPPPPSLLPPSLPSYCAVLDYNSLVGDQQRLKWLHHSTHIRLWEEEEGYTM